MTHVHEWEHVYLLDLSLYARCSECEKFCIHVDRMAWDGHGTECVECGVRFND